jgi:hypothetical protein
MGWVEKIEYEENHACAQPLMDKTFGVGSIWQCDGCNCRWRFDGPDPGVTGPVSWPKWTLLDPV